MDGMHATMTKRYPAAMRSAVAANPLSDMGNAGMLSIETKAQRGGTFSEAELLLAANARGSRGEDATAAAIIATIRRLHCRSCKVTIAIPWDKYYQVAAYNHAYATHELLCSE